MRYLVKWLAVIGLLSGLAAVSFSPIQAYWKARNRPNFRLATVDRGDIAFVINSTGTVKPVLSVQVGSFVSGPIEALYVDFNDEVKKDDLLAKIDPRLYEANVARDRATLATRKAEVDRVKALLQQAKNDEARSIALRAVNTDFISDAEMDQFKFNRMQLEAQLVVADASVEQADANLKTSEANLAYTEIRSPVDGIILDRKIDPGQTLAAQFQTPELFVVAPDMRSRMDIFAAVDETDIGLIRGAQEREQPVRFTVDAYPDELFEGTIRQIRKSSTTTQNVVTYPVVVSAPNQDLKLLPGMTASLSFQIAEVQNVLRIPKDALRYFPQREHVRAEDQKLLDGVWIEDDDEPNPSSTQRSALERAESGRNRNRRHVWVVDGDFLKPVAIVTGYDDSRNIELVSGDIHEGQELVTGIQPKK